jgi:hypothetical protein
MKVKFRKFLSRTFRASEYLLKSSVILMVRKASLRSNGSINLTLDTTNSVDGSGAQLQRLISVYALANYFGLHYVHSEIKQVAVHPLDPFQNEVLYQEYLSQINQFLALSQVDFGNQMNSEPVIFDLRFWKFIYLLLQNTFSNKQRYIAILDPYPVTEFRPDIMQLAKKHISINQSNLNLYDLPYLVIHYRQGVGGFAIYPGQNISRETPLAKFEGVLTSIFKEKPAHSFQKLVVLTDAPKEITYFRPPLDQQKLWEGSPGYAEGVMTIQPIDFNDLGRKFGITVEVIRGGNPIEAVEIMANAEILVMGKSSLSYLGGYLNKIGIVYYPKDFWHRPLPAWRAF